MSEADKIRLQAKIIVDGMAFMPVGDYIYVVNTHNVHYRAKMTRSMNVVTTNMSDTAIKNIVDILRNNIEFL